MLAALTNGVDIRVRGLQCIIHADPSTNAQARLIRQLDIRFDAGAQQHTVAVDLRAI